MDILETANILEAADIVRDLAILISKQKGIKIQEAYYEALEQLSTKKEDKEFYI